MLRQQRRAVHLVGEQDVLAERLVEPEAPRVVVLDLALDAAVEAGEDEVAGGFRESRLLEDRSERRSGPLGRPDGFAHPRLARSVVRDQRAAVSRALERDRERPRGARAEVGEGERQRLPNEAADLEPPRVRVDVRDVEVDQEVVETGRRDRLAQQLERHAVVSRRQL